MEGRGCREDYSLRITAHLDAGKRGSGPIGPAACGCVIDFDGKKISDVRDLGITTINVGEWSGLILVLERVLERGIEPGDELQVYSDSLLVVQQALGNWRVKEPRLRPYREEAVRLASELRSQGCSVMISHVPREQNGVADELVAAFLDDLTRRKRK